VSAWAVATTLLLESAVEAAVAAALHWRSVRGEPSQGANPTQ
jgi:hypothetical protein